MSVVGADEQSVNNDLLQQYKNKEEQEQQKHLLKKTRCYFEICKRNINSEKKKKFEINEKILETDLQKKVLLELKYHELSSKIGWIQLSIIFASTAITFIQTADGVFVFPEHYISTMVSITLSTYVALVLAISRFFKFDESKEQIVNLLSTFALYINKLKTRKQILIDHNFDYFKRDIDYEYKQWNKLTDLFEKDGSAELKVNIDNAIDMLLTKKDVLKYREEMLTLQLQEFIIEQQHTIYSRMEPLMFNHLYKYKTDIGCLNKVFMRIFHTTRFHKKARDMYCAQEIDKVCHANHMEQKTLQLKKINAELKQLYKDSKTMDKVRNGVEDELIRKKMENLINQKHSIREDLINIRNGAEDTKKLLKAYKLNQNTEQIYKELNKNIKIENELGIRKFEAFNYEDIEKKEQAMKNYGYIYGQTMNRYTDTNKLKEDMYKETQELYYPDDYYGITCDRLKKHNSINENRVAKLSNYACSLSSSNFSCSSDSDNNDNNDNKNTKQKFFQQFKRSTHHIVDLSHNNIRLEENSEMEEMQPLEEYEFKNTLENSNSDISSNNSDSNGNEKKSQSLLASLFSYNKGSQNHLESDSDIYEKV